MKRRKECIIHTSLVIGLISLPYSITTHSGRKNHTPRVKPPGILEVKTPAKTSTTKVVKYVEEKCNRIYKKVGMMRELSISRPKEKYIVEIANRDGISG